MHAVFESGQASQTSERSLMPSASQERRPAGPQGAAKNSAAHANIGLDDPDIQGLLVRYCQIRGYVLNNLCGGDLIKMSEWFRSHNSDDWEMTKIMMRIDGQ